LHHSGESNASRGSRLAVERILAGHGYDITTLDLAAAVDYFLAAATHLGVAADAQRELNQMLANHPEMPSFMRLQVSRRTR
jgi:hypothetical protein